MGSSSSTPVSAQNSPNPTSSPLLTNEMKTDPELKPAKAPPAGCPMHMHQKQEEQKGPAEQSNCPMNEEKAKRQMNFQKMSISDCPIHAGKTQETQDNKENQDTLNPANLV